MIKIIRQNKILIFSITLVFTFLFIVLNVKAQDASSTKSVASFSYEQYQKEEGPQINSGRDKFKLDLISKKIDFAISENPELEFKFRKKQNFIKTFVVFLRNIFVDDYKGMEIRSILQDGNSKNNFDVEVFYKGDGKFIAKLKNKQRELKIGKHHLRIFIKDPVLTDNKEIYFDQDFTWGVLALNFNKTIYKLGEKAYLQMAVLDDFGDTLCDADIQLEITKPNGKKIKLNMKDNEIIRNKKCGHNNVINEPDYYAYYSPDEIGEYKIKMIAQTKNGERTIDDKFRLNENNPFEIERIAPTRIYPYANYVVSLKIKANRDYKGEITDIVPSNFVIVNQDVKINQNNKIEFKIEKKQNEKILVWSNFDLQKDDELEISYTVDFPNISPEFYLLGKAQIGDFSEIRNWQIASDAVGAGIAWLTGTSTTFGKNLNQSTSYAMEWSSSDFDSTKYSHSLSLNPNRLVIEEAGDYLIALTIPMIREDANSSRTRIEAEIRVNGTKKDIGVGRSSYIRNYGGLYNKQASDHLHVLLDGLNANDYIEIFVHGITMVDAGDSVIVYDLASMYVEKIEASETVFFASGTETTNSTNLNQLTAYEMEWSTEVREDSGYTHSTSISPEDITLDTADNYLVFINIPLYGDTARQNIMGRVLLGGVQVDGGEFSQGYIRASEGDNYSSIHWSGVVQTSVASEILSISVEREAATGVVTVGTDKATVYVQKLPSSGIYFSRGTNLSSGTDWNQVGPASILWENDDVIDTNTFTHSTAFNAHQISVDKGGDYLVVYNDSLSSPTGRPNPIIDINVNGSPISGAQTKAHYIRDGAENHQHSSGALSFLLTNLSVNDIISVTTKRENDTDTVNDNDDALLMIRYIDNRISPVASINSLNQKTDGSGAIDISVDVVDGNNDDVRLKVEYAGANCSFSLALDPSLDSADASITADFGNPEIDNDYS
jgi:hypothetical protein